MKKDKFWEQRQDAAAIRAQHPLIPLLERIGFVQDTTPMFGQIFFTVPAHPAILNLRIYKDGIWYYIDNVNKAGRQRLGEWLRTEEEFAHWLADTAAGALLRKHKLSLLLR